MNILTIDTATEIEHITIRINGIDSSSSERAKISHSITMFGTIQDLLKNAGCSLRDIDILGVGIGPGSFTGVRIAVTTARMLAQVMSIPLAAISTPEMFARSASAADDTYIMTAFDAKKNRVFGALYHRKNNITAHIIPPGDYPIEYLCHACDKPVIGLGNGIARYRDRIPHSLQLTYIDDFRPNKSAAADMVMERYREENLYAGNYHDILPVYTRKSDAEIALENTARTL